MSQKARQRAPDLWKRRRGGPIHPYAQAMPRQPRLNFPGGIYHVTARGNRRQTVFVDGRDYAKFLGLLGQIVARFTWHCHAYCLMGNHYHLVIETPQGDLSGGMQLLNGGYAQWFNRRHELDGHVFQGRFHAVVVESDWHLVELSRYLALNPVRAGLAADAGGWAWSSYSAVLRGNQPAFLNVSRVLEHFGAEPERARRAFHSFIAAGLERSSGNLAA
jgi:putative transposase